MKVFLSQPMNGKTEEQIKEEREKALAQIRIILPDAKLIDTYITDDLAEKHGGLRYLARSLDMLDEAHVIFMMDGWEWARGCRIEREAAVAYNIPVFYLPRL